MKKTADVKFLEQQGMYLTTEQAAEYLGVSVRTLEDMRRKKKGPRYITLPTSKKIYYKRSELIAWHYAFKAHGVKSSEARTNVRNPLIEYELQIKNDMLLVLVDNLPQAVSAIDEEIVKNCADGFLCFEYRFCGIKAQLFMHKMEIISHATYIFTQE